MKQQILIAVSAIAFISLLIVFVITSEPGTVSGPMRGPSVAPEGLFLQKMDTNGDTAISKHEWEGHFSRVFARIDKNNDGKGTREEFDALKNAGPPGAERGAPPFRDTLFMKTDRDGNGSVEREEWTGHHDQLFRKLDRDGDGSIESGEAGPPRKPGGPGEGPPPFRNVH